MDLVMQVPRNPAITWFWRPPTATDRRARYGFFLDPDPADPWMIAGWGDGEDAASPRIKLHGSQRQPQVPGWNQWRAAGLLGYQQVPKAPVPWLDPATELGQRNLARIMTVIGPGRRHIAFHALEGVPPQAARRSRPPRYDPRTALIVVDLQNDFALPNGSLSVKGGAAIVPLVNREVAAARQAGALVVYTQDWHPARTPHFVTGDGIWPVHCVARTPGAALHAGLRPAKPDLSIKKGVKGEDGYSAFSLRDPRSGTRSETVLHAQLQALGIQRVVVCGLATDYCVKATALDAADLGYRTVLLTGAIAAVNLAPGDGQAAIDEMVAAGVALR
jgi:nicotinamidase/pyrazinamidase